MPEGFSPASRRSAVTKQVCRHSELGSESTLWVVLSFRPCRHPGGSGGPQGPAALPLFKQRTPQKR